MDNDFATGYALGADSASNDKVCVVPANNGGFGGNGSWGEMIFAIIILAMFAGGDGFGGGLFGNRGGGANSPAFQGAVTRADLCSEFNFNNLESGVRGIQQGICDSTYALNNAITSGNNALQMGMMQGFNGVDRSVCQLGYQNQAGFNALGNQLASCCCETKSAIGDVKYQMATDTCAIQNTIQSTTRDIIDNQNANYRGLMDFMVQRDMDALRTENQNLKLAASQANQNAAIGAMISASEATILRRTGAECPTAAYVVQPPTPVSFPVNGCGNFAGWNNGWGNSGGCGNGCGSCC